MAADRVVMSDGTALAVHEHGPPDGSVVVLLHGFPELGYSWRHQIAPLARAGYRLLIPDLRGFGDSDAPADVRAYAIDLLAGDVMALLDHARAPAGILIGHDWGAEIAWKTAWMHPDRITAVAGLSVPFVPRAPAPPLAIMRRRLGEDFYIVWFQEPGVAERALEADVRRTLATTRVWGPEWARETGEPPGRPRHLSEAELAVYVEAFQRTGFRGGLSLYRNIDRNWELTADLESRRVTQPALFLTGERDPVRRFMPAEAMADWVLDLRAHVVVPGSGHWVNQEAPDAVNQALLDWLGGL